MAAQKRQLTMPQAMAVMAIGGVMLALAIVIPTEEGSSAQMWKVLLGLVGVCVAGVGSYLRPIKPKMEEPKMEK